MGLTDTTVERVFKAIVVIITVATLLIGVAWLFLKHQKPSVSALMVPQTLDAQDIPTQDAPQDEGRLVVACVQTHVVGQA